MRRSLVIGAVLCAVALVFVGGPSLFFASSTADIAPAESEDPRSEIVSFEDQESGIWPYLSARQAHDKRSPINVIVLADPDRAIQALTDAEEREWEEVNATHQDAEAGTYALANATERFATDTAWGSATGTTRYAWVDPGPGEPPRWTTETLQLQVGDYYGHRMHIRLYEAPGDDQWAAIQTHSEHFDWFTLKHRVDGVEEAQLAIERDFMELPTVDRRTDVRRINLENDGPADADGWATLVDLSAGAVVPILVLARTPLNRGLYRRFDKRIGAHLTDADRRRLAALADRFQPAHLFLSGLIVVILLGVRIAGIALERHMEMLTMHQIAALLYPFLALGLPVGTYLIAGDIERRIDAAMAAGGALAIGVWLDYGLVSVHSLPVAVVLQRMLLVIALGLIAGGAARRARGASITNDLLLVGAGMWLAVIIGTLFGYL